MGLATLFGEPNLFLPLAQGGHFLVCERPIAARAGHAVFEMWVGAIFGADRMAASVAKLIIADFKAVPDADPLIKDKAFAFPEAFITRHGFEIFQDAALQVEDVFNAE